MLGIRGFRGRVGSEIGGETRFVVAIDRADHPQTEQDGGALLAVIIRSARRNTERLQPVRIGRLVGKEWPIFATFGGIPRQPKSRNVYVRSSLFEAARFQFRG